MMAIILRMMWMHCLLLIMLDMVVDDYGANSIATGRWMNELLCMYGIAPRIGAFLKV